MLCYAMFLRDLVQVASGDGELAPVSAQSVISAMEREKQNMLLRLLGDLHN